MLAAVFKEVGLLEMEDRPRPEITSGDEVLIRVAACGVCGTDLHILADPPSHPASIGVILGHEFVGDIEDLATAGDQLRVGDRVAIRPILACGVCSQCLSGFPNHCLRSDTIGVYRDGGLAAYALVPRRACISISPSIPAPTAALTEPLACVVNGVKRLAPAPGQSAVILGAGAIGLLFLAVLRSFGIQPIVVVEPLAIRRAVAARLGADHVVDPTIEPPTDAIRTHVPDGPYAIVDAVGSQIHVAVEIAVARSRILLFGIDSRARPEVGQMGITEKELTIMGSYVGQHTFPDAIAILESGRLDLTPILTHVVGLSDLPSVIEQARLGQVVKAVVEMD